MDEPDDRIEVCIQPDAPWVKCCICERLVKTCHQSDNCPIHLEGYQNNGRWFCSGECEDVHTTLLRSRFDIDLANY